MEKKLEWSSTLNLKMDEKALINNDIYFMQYNNLYEQKYHRKKLSNDVKKLDKMKFIENQQQEKI